MSAMLASTLIAGGHYFSDLVAGVAVAVAAIVVARRLSREPAGTVAAGEDGRGRALDGAAVV